MPPLLYIKAMVENIATPTTAAGCECREHVEDQPSGRAAGIHRVATEIENAKRDFLPLQSVNDLQKMTCGAGQTVELGWLTAPTPPLPPKPSPCSVGAPQRPRPSRPKRVEPRLIEFDDNPEQPKRCRFPFAEHPVYQGRHLFCAAPTFGGAPYCRTHCVAAFNPQGRRYASALPAKGLRPRQRWDE